MGIMYYKKRVDKMKTTGINRKVDELCLSKLKSKNT